MNINLDTGQCSAEERGDLAAYIGGIGVSCKLMNENLLPNPQLQWKQPVVLAIGPLTCAFPAFTKTAALYIGPEENGTASGPVESYTGGKLAMSMLAAGYTAIVITGTAERQSSLVISPNGILLDDSDLMCEPPAGECESIITVDSSGENRDGFAGVYVDSDHQLGRHGLGACVKNKNLKTIIIKGSQSDRIKNMYTGCTGCAIGCVNFGKGEKKPGGRNNKTDKNNNSPNNEYGLCILNSLVMCLFAEKIYDRQRILDALDSVNRPLTDNGLDAAGQRIYEIKQQLKSRCKALYR